MIIMTIWWSKATRLLEFSRSRPQSRFAPRPEEEVGPGFFVTEDRGGIGYSSSWIVLPAPSACVTCAFFTLYEKSKVNMAGNEKVVILSEYLDIK